MSVSDDSELPHAAPTLNDVPEEDSPPATDTALVKERSKRLWTMLWLAPVAAVAVPVIGLFAIGVCNVLLAEYGRGTPQLIEYATEIVDNSRLKLIDESAQVLDPNHDYYAFYNASKVYLDNQFVGTNPEPRGLRENGFLQISGQESPALLPVDGEEIGMDWYAVTALKDGRLFVSGGAPRNDSDYDASKHHNQGFVANRTWIYDPRNKKVIEGPQLINPRYFHTTTLLEDGRVLVTGGGATLSGVDVREAEIFDPKQSKMVSAGMLSKPRSRHAVLQLRNGNVLVCGGETDPDFSDAERKLTATVELYNLSTGSWTVVGQLRQARREHYCFPTDDNGAIIIGGETDEYRDHPGTQTIRIAEKYLSSRTGAAKKVFHFPNFGDLIQWWRQQGRKR